MMKRMAACAVIALGLLGMAAPATAQSYTYDFTFTPNGGSLITARGMFTSSAPGTPVFTSLNLSGSFTDNSGNRYNSDGGFINLNPYNFVGTLNSGATSFFFFVNSPFPIGGVPQPQYVYSNNTYTANLQAFVQTIGLKDSNGTIPLISLGQTEGTFVARLESSSGTAPSPEVNAGLGLLLAGATFAFLRRRRGGRSDLLAA